MLDAVDRGMPRAEVARIFRILLPSIKRWLRRRRETGEVGAKAPSLAHQPSKERCAKSGCPTIFGETPTSTLKEHCEAFEEERGVRVSTATMNRRISELPGGRWPIKKVARSPRARRGSQRTLEVAGEPLRCQAAGVFIDESGFHTSMTRLRARAPKGKRAYGKVPRDCGNNTTLIASVTLEGVMGEAIDHRRCHRRGGLRRDLFCRALPDPHTYRRAGGGYERGASCKKRVVKTEAFAEVEVAGRAKTCVS